MAKPTGNITIFTKGLTEDIDSFVTGLSNLLTHALPNLAEARHC